MLDDTNLSSALFFGTIPVHQQQDDAKRRNSWDFFNFENTLNDVGIEADRRGQEDIASMLRHHMQMQSRNSRSLTANSMSESKIEETGQFFCISSEKTWFEIQHGLRFFHDLLFRPKP
jgi:hypothetical protein